MTPALRLPMEFHQENRRLFMEHLPDGSAALLFAGKAPRRSADGHYGFHANRNYFYLAGLEQEEGALLLAKIGGELSATLFSLPPDDLAERWRGRRLKPSELEAASGISATASTLALPDRLSGLVRSGDVERLYLDFDPEDSHAAVDSVRILARDLRERFPALVLSDAWPILAALRERKRPEEIACLREAIRITGLGIDAMMRACRPGLPEQRLEAEFLYAIGLEGVREPAFPSIVAAGDSVFQLHYTSLSAPIPADRLVQVDVGATAGGLCADISRCFPSGGRFDGRQRALYDGVRRCLETALSAIGPGVRFDEVRSRCEDVAWETLRDMGHPVARADIRNHFWHGVSHSLGHDVHDVLRETAGPGNRPRIYQPGMVVSVEPGLYIPEWGLGLRLEEDALVTGTGCENLSAGIPVDPEAIEAFMGAR